VDAILAAPIAAGLVGAYDAYYRMSLPDMLDLCEILLARAENERRAASEKWPSA